MRRLEGKVCLITGAGSGIGRASALAFAAEGAQIAVADIDGEAAAETVRQIEGAGTAGDGRSFTVDVTDPADCEGLASSVIAACRGSGMFVDGGVRGSK